MTQYTDESDAALSTTGSTDNIPQLTQFTVDFQIDAGGRKVRTVSSVTILDLKPTQAYYQIDMASITFIGDGSVVDGMSTEQLFKEISDEAVTVSISLQLTTCPPNCAGPIPVRIYAFQCVTRLNAGCETAFTPCGGTEMGLGYREYQACCPSGPNDPTVNEQVVHNAPCGPGCNNTCPL